jgi:hypothetical protein
MQFLSCYNYIWKQDEILYMILMQDFDNTEELSQILSINIIMKKVYILSTIQMHIIYYIYKRYMYECVI